MLFKLLLLKKMMFRIVVETVFNSVKFWLQKICFWSVGTENWLNGPTRTITYMYNGSFDDLLASSKNSYLEA